MNKNHNEQDYSEIHIVNKGNSKKGLSLETTIHGEILSQETLLNCLKENKLPKLENVLAADSKLVFHTSELGKNKNLLQILKQTFTANYQPKVFATPQSRCKYSSNMSTSCGINISSSRLQSFRFRNSSGSCTRACNVRAEINAAKYAEARQSGSG